MNSIVNTLHSIDIEKYSSIEEQRNKILQDKEFQKWCKELHIGSRVEVRSESMNRGTELMNQYPQYPKWVMRQY